MSKTFDINYVNTLADHNYFGSQENGYSSEQQRLLRHAWLTSLESRGIVVGEFEITEENENWFESQCQAALIAINN